MTRFNESVLFFDVDTQQDFMNKSGALYVPEAEIIKPILEKITSFAKEYLIRIVGDMDWHTEKDPEMKANNGPFPFHCMRNTKGAERIPETGSKFFKDIPIAETLEKFEEYWNNGYVLIPKTTYDVFSNPMMDAFIIMKLFGKMVVVYGVATDFCVKTAVNGFLERGVKVIVLEDAIKALDSKNGQLAIAEMKKNGALFMSYDKLNMYLLENNLL